MKRNPRYPINEVLVAMIHSQYNKLKKVKITNAVFSPFGVHVSYDAKYSFLRKEHYNTTFELDEYKEALREYNLNKLL